MSRNILIIEDDQDALANLRDILELDDYTVTGAGTLREARQGRPWSDYSVIILDRRLPDGSADSILPQIREKAPDAAVIITTGYADLNNVIAALRTGAADYLFKPVNPDLLRATIARAMAMREMQRERQELETRLLRAQRLESIGTLAGGIAHDLNNMLTPILMSIRLLQKDRNPADRPALLETARASVERGAALIKQLLDFAGGKAGHKSSIDLRHLVGEVRDMLARTLSKSIIFHTEMADDLCPVAGDATQLSQVLINLCVNARDAMPDGGELTVGVKNVTVSRPVVAMPDKVQPGQYVLLSVVDTGTGMTRDVLDKMFDPFFTTKEFGKGTGLGLSTTLGIVRGHGGSMNVYSEPGRGTQIVIYLPVLGGAAKLDNLVQSAQIPHGHDELILLVDDEESILLTAGMLLESSGYRVVTARNGAEALEQYRENAGAVRAVVLDMMMPGMDGPATMEALARHDPAVRIIAVSGLRAGGAAGDVVAKRACAFLQKPYSDEDLLNALARVIGGERARVD